ncbi:Protocadherin Fat 4 [Geodia barretti]|uniref:Protocadherin Fat 4 n=1 Tax=Geodia barretti TaxID=519541 RepID=A0AA35QW22_GEOBA|nr:Protocadherin Fat 4 [Geodia barretti]
MIEGANEHAPEFASDRYDVDISEYNILASAQQHTAGEIIATVTATDADANDEIEYIITGGNEDNLFEIPNPLFGNIVLKDPTLIDFETTTSYALIITATDLVIPESDRRTTTTYLYISVLDENDNLPVFSNDMYTGRVDEEAPIGTSIILTIPISVTDADSLYGMETVEFEINTVGSPLPSPFLAFTLSEDGTSLTTTIAIDREEDEGVFTFQMRVVDAAGNEDTAMMTVDILDINDNAPMIQEPQGGFLIMVAENNPVNSVLVTITAEDTDLGVNAEVFFTLQGGAGYFDIGHDTGVVTQIGSLQALEPPVTFTLTVIARDSGGLSSSRDLIVNLTYSNDHAPVFESSVYSGSVAECAEDGTPISPVLTLRATDDDTDSVVSYYIESSSVGDLFQLENIGQTATIRSAGSSVFDRESRDTYTFTVYATDGIIGTDDDSATVTIFISDCNDHSPIFTQDMYEVDVPEGTASGATVIQVHTNDADIGENEEVRFNVESVSPSSFSNVFHVDPLTGGIVASVNIDNTYTGSSACSTLDDHSNNVTLTIKATDQATMQDQLSNYTTVFIRLLDRNSEAPSFVPSSFYSFEISENVDGVDLGTVEAVDECDMDSDVTFFLVSGQDSAPFEIDQDTGVIRVIAGLDREVNDFLVVQLQAVDDGTDPGPQTGHASVTINVLDENDNAPKLVRDTYDISLPENIPVSTTLISIVASDPDLDENGTISFSMQSGDSDLFMLEGSPAGSDSDHLVTKVSLDRERVSVHIVTILVSDAGSPQKNSTAVMTLTLTDVNDNVPVWTAGQGSEFEIFENVTNSLVVDLDATDRDDGLNQELVYFFVGGSQDYESFHIDRNDGTLHIARDLDYETTPEYTLNIVVSDRRAETDDDGVTPLTNSTTIHIIVTDVNDNEPYFNRCPHGYEIPETFRVGAVVGNNIKDSVEDDDSLAIRTPFYYYIDSPENVECFGPFCIDLYTGEITLESNIDFETTPTYTFYVVVSDMPNLSPEEVYIPPRIDLCDKVGTEKNNITRVDVVLTDVNDQEPVFDPNSLLAAVAEEAEFDTTVTVLKAIDKDENDTFSTVYYEIIAVDPPYLVNRETGEVTTADTFTGRSGETDKFTVVAYDNRGNEPSFTSTAILTVRVFKECEQIVAVADQTREEAEKCRTQLETGISNQTGYIIYITKIRVHQDEEQNIVDTTKADMIFYALHLTTGDLVPPTEVIAIIERGLDFAGRPHKESPGQLSDQHLQAILWRECRGQYNH